jgi:hypothetical protein
MFIEMNGFGNAVRQERAHFDMGSQTKSVKLIFL